MKQKAIQEDNSQSWGSLNVYVMHTNNLIKTAKCQYFWHTYLSLIADNGAKQTPTAKSLYKSVLGHFICIQSSN